MIEWIKKTYNRYSEMIGYLFFGGVTTVANLAVYTVMVEAFGVNETFSNACAWFVAVMVAFFTNKVWVFHTKFESLPMVLKELILFVGARVATGVIEVGGFPLLLYLGVDQKIFGVRGLMAKVVLSVIVIILNYIFSKFIIFTKKDEKKQGEDREEKEKDED